MAEDPQQQLNLNLFPYPDPDTVEAWIRNPREHGRLVHGGGMGCVAIAQKGPNDFWRERAYPVEVALELLKHCGGQEDVYLSTQRFRGRRRIAHLLSMGALYTDLDYYRIPELARAHPLVVLETALDALEKAAMPEPTLAIGSGRGLYLLWLHGPIPRAALPRWSACQRELWEVLKPLGADRAAIDAARVLRVVGTVHREASAVVEPLAPVGKFRTFEELAKAILPLDRAELRDLRVRHTLRATKSPFKRFQVPGQGVGSIRAPDALIWPPSVSERILCRAQGHRSPGP